MVGTWALISTMTIWEKGLYKKYNTVRKDVRPRYMYNMYIMLMTNSRCHGDLVHRILKFYTVTGM